jgi:glucosyl-dolichyl phosphate glucuronosyltransferase
LSNLDTDGRFAYEVVVIDKASIDETPQVIAAAAAKSRQPIRGIHEPKKGIVPARNRGIREASGQWIAFFDDDQLADRRWLIELYRGAHEKKCRVVGGSVHLALPEGCSRRLHPAVRMLLGEVAFGNEPLPYGGRVTPGCGNLMVERTVFEQIGAFERTVNGRGEDPDLFSRIEQAGIAAWYWPAARIERLAPQERLNDNYLLGLARRAGEGAALRRVGRVRFGPLWLAKAIRLALVQSPLAGLARISGDREMWLGRRLLLAINASFVRCGWKLLWPGRSEQEFTAGEMRQTDFEPKVHCASLMHPTK